MNRRGFILIITMFILLLLALLAMNLLLLSATALLIARNERDEMITRNYAEGIVQIGKGIILRYANADPKPYSLTYLLEGPKPGGSDDNLLDLSPWKQLNMGINTIEQLRDSGEKRSAGMTIRNFDGSLKRWEFFSDVVNEKRAVVYLRIEDNYDEESAEYLYIDNPSDDKDFRVNLLVVVEYPVVIDKKETVRGVSRAQMNASFAPDGLGIERMVSYEEIQ